MENTSQQHNHRPHQYINYYKLLRVVWSRWYWVAACLLVAFLGAKIYLWYTPHLYATSASLKFSEDRSELSNLLKSSAPYYSRTDKIQAEMFVIRSRDVALRAISKLDYRVSYFLKGRIRTTDIYPKVPFPIEIIHQDSSGFYRGMFQIKLHSDNQFDLSWLSGTDKIEKTYKYGDTIRVYGLIFRVKRGDAWRNSIYNFRFNNKEDFLGRVLAGLSMREAAKSSNILELTQTDINPWFASDVLNAILQEYLRFDQESKSQSASQTIEFIEGQLAFLTDQVRRSGSELAHFKQTKNIIDFTTSTRVYVDNLSEQQSQKNLLKIQELAINQLEQQVYNHKDQLRLNFNIEGTVDPLLSGLITQWNSLIVDRTKKLTQFNAGSQPITEIDKQLSDIKKAIISNIQLSRQRNQKTLRYIDSQINQIQQNISALPTAEKDFVNLQVDFDINQKVFSFLSEKKLEAQIAQAAVVPGAIILDKSANNYQLVSPLPKKVYTQFLIVGFLAGLGLIFFIRMLNPYIYDKETVESLTNIPIIGIIRKFPGYVDTNNKQILSLHKPKSIYAESVRSVRTNLSFLASEKKSKVICITSEIAGEGKSFVSINLASTLAIIDKRVVLVAADLRMSKLHHTFRNNNKAGLSTYLSNQHTLLDIIFKTDTENLDIIPSGPVPPNPSELLHSTKMKILFRELKKKYDYIILDTAPVGLVSDSIPLIRQSGINLFVIRSGVSRYNAAAIPDRLAMEYGLKNIVIVLNAFDGNPLHRRYYSTDYSSGNYKNYYYYSDYAETSSYYARQSGYGYYTHEEKPVWWKFWQRK